MLAVTDLNREVPVGNVWWLMYKLTTVHSMETVSRLLSHKQKIWVTPPRLRNDFKNSNVQRLKRTKVKERLQDMTRWHTHALTVIGTVGTMPAQDQANQHSSQKVERKHRSYCSWLFLMEDNSVMLKGRTDSSGQSVPCPESYGHHNLGSMDYSRIKMT